MVSRAVCFFKKLEFWAEFFFGESFVLYEYVYCMKIAAKFEAKNVVKLAPKFHSVVILAYWSCWQSWS